MSEPTIFPDPMDEFPFTIVHPSTGDRAYAEDRESAQVAAYQLERDCGVQTGSQRAMIAHRPNGGK